MARGGGSKESEDFPRKLKIFAFLFILLISFGTITTALIKNLSFKESVDYTFETLAFMFHEEEGPAKYLEIFMAIFGVFLIWWILWSVFDTVFEKSFKDYLHTLDTLKRLKKMKNHYVIAGGGRVGDEIAKKLFKQKKQFIIIEKEPSKIKLLRKEGFKALEGDITQEKTLEKAKIKNASTLIITSPNTEINLLVTLLAKELNKDLKIYVRADKPEYESVLLKAGAKKVIMPEISAAKDMFSTIMHDETNIIKEN